ncbi:hypothetical protein DPMN_025448 [Dreissena polymorpha]|uniref:Uncharacterized protein n=1 Tax=Dreissena polymorpha TaxID=45954 RepID=A0A9D4LTB3_DREPO|nr:hypothetical protein DPMN_025448 [Dreissena polymorpha]
MMQLTSCDIQLSQVLHGGRKVGQQPVCVVASALYLNPTVPCQYRRYHHAVDGDLLDRTCKKPKQKCLSYCLTGTQMLKPSL